MRHTILLYGFHIFSCILFYEQIIVHCELSGILGKLQWMEVRSDGKGVESVILDFVFKFCANVLVCLRNDKIFSAVVYLKWIIKSFVISIHYIVHIRQTYLGGGNVVVASLP